MGPCGSILWAHSTKIFFYFYFNYAVSFLCSGRIGKHCGTAQTGLFCVFWGPLSLLPYYGGCGVEVELVRDFSPLPIALPSAQWVPCAQGRVAPTKEQCKQAYSASSGAFSAPSHSNSTSAHLSLARGPEV